MSHNRWSTNKRKGVEWTSTLKTSKRLTKACKFFLIFEFNNFLPFFSFLIFDLFFFPFFLFIFSIKRYKKDYDKQKATQKRDRVSFNETFLTERAHPAQQNNFSFFLLCLASIQESIKYIFIQYIQYALSLYRIMEVLWNISLYLIKKCVQYKDELKTSFVFHSSFLHTTHTSAMD